MHRILGLLFLVVAIAAFLPKESSSTGNGQTIYGQFLVDKIRFHQQVQQLADYVRADAPADSLRAAFGRSRRNYKHIEWLLDYYQLSGGSSQWSASDGS